MIDFKVTLTCGHTVKMRTFNLSTLPGIGSKVGCVPCHCDTDVAEINWTTDNGGGVVVAAGHVD